MISLIDALNYNIVIDVGPLDELSIDEALTVLRDAGESPELDASGRAIWIGENRIPIENDLVSVDDLIGWIDPQATY